MNYCHGGDVLTYREQYGRDPLDFSANINPLGMPQPVQEAVRRSASRCAPYPDPCCRALTAALAEKEGLPPGQVLVGNGAADLIFRLAYALRPRRALLLCPGFAEYEAALRAAGCQCSFFPLREEEGFRLGEDFLPLLEDPGEVVFLCNPNNPTGECIPRQLLEQILEKCRQAGALLVVDECFRSFLDEPDQYTMKPFLQGNPGLLLLGAFTKLYAMAGLRLGWCFCSDRALLDKMEAAAQPWSVSIPAMEAGLAALKEDAFVRRSRALVSAERERLRAGLAAAGMKVYGSRANYLFFHSPLPALGERMKRRGILLRDCSNYRGLGPGFYRAAVRLPEENSRLLAALAACLAEEE